MLIGVCFGIEIPAASSSFKKSFTIVTVAVPTAIRPPAVAPDRATVKSRFGWVDVFGMIGTLIVCVVTPGANVSVPLFAV